MDIKKILQGVIAGRDLAESEAQTAAEAIMTGALTEAQIAGLLIALRMKGETVDEITGFARAMRSRCRPVICGSDRIVDTCGTGGDGQNTFNISTASALVAAAAGCRIAKHGNRSVSSCCGSADVLNALGINIELEPRQAAQGLEETGFGFLFAPRFHPAMAAVAKPRKELGVRTIFNILGPLTNPAQAKRQVLGVCEASLVEPMGQALQRLGVNHGLVVHGQDGLDEISLNAKSLVCEIRSGATHTFEIDPADFGFAPAEPDALRGGDAEENSRFICSILKGATGPRRDITLLNAGAAIYVSGMVQTLEEGVAQAQAAIDSGRAYKKLALLREYYRRP